MSTSATNLIHNNSIVHKDYSPYSIAFATGVHNDAYKSGIKLGKDWHPKPILESLHEVIQYYLDGHSNLLWINEAGNSFLSWPIQPIH